MRRPTLPSALLSLVVLCTASSAVAQAAPSTPNGRFSANRFMPAPGAGNYIMVDGAVVGGHLTPTLGLFVDYAHRPFVVFTATCKGSDPEDCELDKAKTELVSYQLTFSPMATLTLWQRLQLGLVVPVVATSGDSFSEATPGRAEPLINIRGGDAFGLGDPRLNAKVRILGQGGEGFYLALVGFVTAPVGEAMAEGRSVGDDGVTGGGHLVLEGNAGKLRLAANLGGVVRPKRELLSTEVGPEATYGAGLSFDATELLRLIGELTGATQLTAQVDENPVEARAAAELTAGDVAFTVGGGVGLISGVGVPDFRVFGGVAYRPAGLDSDGDGVRDTLDACPTQMEDEDGFEDQDGCPDEDNDNDGMLDPADKCPDQPEDADGVQDTDGCPDNDNDGDGILDGYDSCPDQPEDKDHDRDEDGCPDDDRDRDGVPDATDKCPKDPEDTDGFGDEDGCPETDFDGDGVADDEDQCPDEPEDKDGVEDEDGCPDTAATAVAPAPPSLIKVTCDKIEVAEKIYFKTSKAVIENRSHELLTQIAAALLQAKHVKKLRVEGHTDNRGNAKSNMKLSDARAAAVRDFLISAGVGAERLESKGFGADTPIADNKTKTGREANRRVEFVIVDQSGQCVK